MKNLNNTLSANSAANAEDVMATKIFLCNQVHFDDHIYRDSLLDLWRQKPLSYNLISISECPARCCN